MYLHKFWTSDSVLNYGVDLSHKCFNVMKMLFGSPKNLEFFDKEQITLTDMDLDLVLRACRPDLVLLLALAAMAADFGPDIP